MQEKMTPADNRAEESLVACLLANPNNAVKVMDILKPEYFARDDYGVVFQAAQNVYRQGRYCTKANVLYELRKQDKLSVINSGPRGENDKYAEYFLDYLMLGADMYTDILDYASIIKDEFTFREIARIGHEMFQAGLRREDGILERAQQMIMALSVGSGNMNTVRVMPEIMSSFLTITDQRRENFLHHVANGLPTGFVDLDRMIGGLQPADLIILAARPSVGKTALAVNIALNIVKKSKHALMFSLEMKAEAIAQRMIAMEVPMDQSNLRDGDIDDEQYSDIIEKANDLSQLDFKIDDRTRLIDDIRNKARNVHMQKKLDLIVIDYLQLAAHATTNKNALRAEIVAEMSKGLKALAMELNIPVLALAQLNRSVESRQDKTPQLSDLKESGSIEQDADLVLFLHVSDEELEKRMQCVPYQVNVVVGKQRNGMVGTSGLLFKPRSTRYTNLEVENLEGE